ncbi:hypothetical protein AAT17_03780 [Nonlabens sp. MIC269]|uniref:fasciclin domain-containing protein n=1 Tax=Nonlabens sp. MIC269 TaxID=1476901 RepID=UPI00071F5E6A|nr:fasciclin domain-containing protein [Nonlabens sp. MIC269]ALM20414.1 hypothetical protein AAT17_03780 [Nonlabens sp. MIC269]
MKSLNLKSLLFSFLAIASLTLTSCDDDDDNIIDSNNSAYDLTVSNSNFTSLRAALERTGLDATLDGNGTFTVFAPTDTAFTTFLSANGFASLDAVPTDVLRNVLLNHVLGSVNRSGDLVDGYVKTSATDASGNNLDAYIDASAFTVNNAAIDTSQVNIEVDNGVVHVMDAVIPLPTVADLAVYNPAFGNLVTAVSQEGLVAALSATDASATPAPPFTVFAPTNDAFQALIDADPNDGLNNINDVLALNNLSDILLYHVVSGAAVRAEAIMDGDVVDPITMGTFTINTTNGVVITDGTNTETNVIVTNVTGINGVVHAIDFVLRP